MLPRSRVAMIVVGSVLLLVLLAVGLAWSLLDGSLPPLDGTRVVDGLDAELRVERDAKGRTTVTASSRADLAFGLGFAHGQDRFFQMDLLRRAGSGELAALIGRMGLALDRRAREHDLARTARRAFASISFEHRAQLEAYARGVNAGRESLRARPWEYFLLRQRPEPWRAVDALHVVHAMMRDLQVASDLRELSRPVVENALVEDVASVVLEPWSPWDAPIVDDPTPVPVVEVPASGPARVRDADTPRTGEGIFDVRDPDEPAKGSNSFAVGGRFTEDGRAMLANDMHLGLRVPNIWYAVRLVVDGDVDAVGVTLPGAPVLIVGSNGFVAWGFTNSYGDWVDHVRLEIDPEDDTRYRTPDGWRPFDERVEVIEIAGGATDTLVVRDTIWGPQNARIRQWHFATRWVAREADAVNTRLMDMLDVRTVDEALDLASECGLPHQNLVVADADGRLGWTVMGRVPRRVGLDGTTPVSWADGDVGWRGWLGPDEVPRHVFGPEGKMWTANGRVTRREAQRVIGIGNYALGARATVIRDAVLALDTAREEDLLAVANLTRSPLMQRWYERLRAVIAGSDVASHRDVAPWLDDWSGGADVESVAYGIVRAWRREVTEAVYDDGLLGPTVEDANGNWIRAGHREPVVWALLKARPAWVPAAHVSWDELERAALDSVVARRGDPRSWADRTWGARNTTSIEHPFAEILPGFLARHLRMPRRQVAGDSYTAHVASPTFGASERFVVRPGAEEHGILHLPGGNAAHPRSPFFLGTYEDWVVGRPTPLLPGPPAHTLVLEPDA